MIRRGLFDSAARKGWRQAGFAANSFADECIYGFQSTVLGGDVGGGGGGDVGLNADGVQLTGLAEPVVTARDVPNRAQ